MEITAAIARYASPRATAQRASAHLEMAPPFRILHVVDSLGVGGTELTLAALIGHTRAGFAHSVCCVRAAGPTAIRLSAMGVPIAVLGKTRGKNWSLPVRFARLCRQVAPDIVHTRNWGSVDAIIGARLARVPVVIHSEHGRDASDPNGTNRRRNRARRVLSLFVDRMVTVSEQLQYWLIEDVGIAAAKVSVIRNGVDLDRFRPVQDREALRQRYGVRSADFVVGTVGRLDAVKNQASLLEVVNRLAPTHPNIRLLIAGDGPEKEALQHEAVRRGLNGTARLLGHRDDVPEVLNLLDLFVLPSLGEGMCNTVLEAMAVGLPVVATRVGGNPELVDDGTTGQLVPARDAAALARAIARYAADEQLRRDHGAAGRRRVVEQFTLDRMIERYVALYEGEMGKKRVTNGYGL